MKNIVIVGGGTAGWMTALYAKKSNPRDNVVLIESEQIGILGAGEGSVPELIEFINFLEIPAAELIKNCSATIKNGIKFTNWSEEKKHFYHPFFSNCPASNDYNFSLQGKYIETDGSFSHVISSKFDHEVSQYSFIDRISEENKVPIIIDEHGLSHDLGSWSLHFDANMLAKYLRTVGEKRGIVRKEGTVVDIVSDSSGYINKIITNKKEEFLLDFVFDCTGFKRLIIGKHFETKWKSHSNILPANSAIPFFLPIDDRIPPYTEAIAMDYGWVWKIPLQHRYGCGYVFDNNKISFDNAKKEIDDLLGFEVESPRSFDFNAGCYRSPWVKNCLAVGLSAGFLEPLEATSIFQAIRQLKDFFTLVNHYEKNNEKTVKNFNEKYLNDTEEIVDFLYLHYLTKKENTDFWQNFSKNNEMPEFIKYIIDVIKERPLSLDHDFLFKEIFKLAAYNYVLVGNEILDKKLLKKHYYLIKNKDKEYLDILKNQNYILPVLTSHEYYLNLQIGQK